MAMRLDLALVERYGFTRNKARQLIEVGLIRVNTQTITKASYTTTPDDIIDIVEDRRVEWVSRSAEKLCGFIEYIESIGKHIEIPGTRCLDVGSSTGGFTQVLLQYGADHVDAVDVGRDQLHHSLRSDARVTSLEQMDIRDFVADIPYDIIVCDASFISLTDILDAILSHADHETDIILLYKPQFEVGQKNLRKTWVPKDEQCILDAMRGFESLLTDRWCTILEREKSSLIGEAGNQEWVYWVRR